MEAKPLSTDAEKAFDRVDWQFLQSTLRHIGLGSRMQSWIQALYTGPTAAVLVNGVRSEYFPLSNGTRQGCPLSLLIFALTLEPFLCKVRLDPLISGIQVSSMEHKIAAYADDLLFFLTDPEASLPHLFQCFTQYKDLSNFSINNVKSEAMSILLPMECILKLQCLYRFKWVQSFLKYLGVKLINFCPLLSKM